MNYTKEQVMDGLAGLETELMADNDVKGLNNLHKTLDAVVNDEADAVQNAITLLDW